MRMTTWLPMLMAAVAAVPTAAAAQPKQGLEFVDYTDDFDRVWQQVAPLPDGKKVAAFQTAFAKILPGFYEPERVSDFIPPDRYRELMLSALRDYPKRRAGIQKVSRDFAGLVGPAQREFEARFGPMTGYPSVLLVHSLGEFDGGTRKLADGMHLMFGAEMIDLLYQDKPIKPFVQHELFHLLHGRTFADCDAVYCNLWQEGLATYVAATLNPNADHAALGMTIPAPIRPAVEANRAAAICEVRKRIHSNKPDDYAPLFYGSKKLHGFPARMGYYIGYLVAQGIGKGRDLKQLAAMQPAEVRPLVIQSLDRMADCTAGAGERG
jgi:hypothetical protein